MFLPYYIVYKQRQNGGCCNQKIARYRFYSDKIGLYLVGNLMNATASSGIIERWDWYLILFVQKLQRFLLVCL